MITTHYPHCLSNTREYNSLSPFSNKHKRLQLTLPIILQKSVQHIPPQSEEALLTLGNRFTADEPLHALHLLLHITLSLLSQLLRDGHVHLLPGSSLRNTLQHPIQRIQIALAIRVEGGKETVNRGNAAEGAVHVPVLQTLHSGHLVHVLQQTIHIARALVVIRLSIHEELGIRRINGKDNEGGIAADGKTAAHLRIAIGIQFTKDNLRITKIRIGNALLLRKEIRQLRIDGGKRLAMTAPRSVELQKHVGRIANQRINVVGQNCPDMSGRTLDHHVGMDLAVRPLDKSLRRPLPLEIDRLLGIAAREELDGWISADIVLRSNVHLFVCINLGDDKRLPACVNGQEKTYTLEKASAKRSYSGASFLQ